MWQYFNPIESSVLKFRQHRIRLVFTSLKSTSSSSSSTKSPSWSTLSVALQMHCWAFGLTSINHTYDCLKCVSVFEGNGPSQGCQDIDMYYIGIVFSKCRKYIFWKEEENILLSMISGWLSFAACDAMLPNDWWTGLVIWMVSIAPVLSPLFHLHCKPCVKAEENFPYKCPGWCNVGPTIGDPTWIRQQATASPVISWQFAINHCVPPSDSLSHPIISNLGPGLHNFFLRYIYMTDLY